VSGHLRLTLEVCLPAILFILLLLGYSLREFSRSTLETLCAQRKQPERFTSILRSHRQAQLFCDGSSILLIITAALLYTDSSWAAAFAIPAPFAAGPGILWVLRAFALCLLVTGAFVGLPWAIARVKGEQLLLSFWPLLAVVVTVLRPCWRVVFAVDQAMHRVAGLPDPDSSEATTILEEELRTVVDEGRREGIIHSNASRMIHRVVDLQDEDVASIMTPRTDMVTIPAATPLNDALDMVVEENYSRIPVTGESIDDIVGVLYARDLLAELRNLDSNGVNKTVGDAARETVFVPESQRIGLLLENMQQKKIHLAIVVDEYSGVAGLVTLEDILEEIVGEISDEHDEEEHPMLTVADDGSLTVDGRFHIDDLNREHGFDFPEDEEYDTIGGFMMAEMARIPAVGESIEWNGTSIRVTDADERHLKTLKLMRSAQS